jgi:hypothetical protein
MQTEQAAMLGGDSLDAFGRQNLGKRQSLTPQKRVGDFLKTLAVSTRRMWYLCGLSKNPPWVFASSVTKEGFTFITKRGQKHQTDAMARQRFSKTPARVRGIKIPISRFDSFLSVNDPGNLVVEI